MKAKKRSAEHVARESTSILDDRIARLGECFPEAVVRKLKEDLCRRVAAELSHGRSWSDILSRPVSVKVSPKIDFSMPDMPKPLSLRDVKLNSAEFDEIMRPFVIIPRPSDNPYSTHRSSLLTPVRQVLDEAGMNTDSLDVLLLHGGACRNPWVRHCLTQAIRSNDLFRETRIEETPDLDASVARGAAFSAYSSRARGREIIRPIATSEVGIMTQGEHPVPLIARGTPLPFPESQDETEEYDDFFIPKDRPREMLVPFYCRVGEDCRIAGTVRVAQAQHA